MHPNHVSDQNCHFTPLSSNTDSNLWQIVDISRHCCTQSCRFHTAMDNRPSSSNIRILNIQTSQQSRGTKQLGTNCPAPRDWGSNRQLGWQEMTNCKRWRRHAFRPCVASNHPHDETFFRTKELLLSRFQSLAREHSMPLLTQARAHLPLNCQRKRPLSGRSFPKQSVDQPTCVEYISMHYIVRNIRDKLKNNKTIHTYI